MASKFYTVLQGIVAEEKGIGISIPNGRLFIIWEGKYCGIWEFSEKKVRFEYLHIYKEEHLKDHIVRLLHFDTWKRMMIYKRNHARALILYGVYKQLGKLFQKACGAVEIYIMANGWWDQYSQLSAERKEHIDLAFYSVKKMGMQLRHNFLKRLIHERSLKKIYRKSFPKLDSAFRNTLMKQPQYLSDYIQYKREFNQYAKLIHFKNMDYICEILRRIANGFPLIDDPILNQYRENYSEYVFEWFRRYNDHDSVMKLGTLMTESTTYTLEGICNLHDPNWFYRKHEEYIARRAAARDWAIGQSEEMLVAQDMMLQAWELSIPENRSNTVGVTLLETAEDYAAEGELMQHCVGQYWEARASHDSYLHVYHLEYAGESATMMLKYNANGIHLMQIYGVQNTRISSNMKYFASNFYCYMRFRNRSRFMDYLRRF